MDRRENAVEEAWREFSCFGIFHPRIEVRDDDTACHVLGNLDRVAGNDDECPRMQRHHRGVTHRSDHCRVLGERTGENVGLQLAAIEVVQKDARMRLDQGGRQSLVGFLLIVTAGEG